jgi:DNA-binding transcriptional MerR regulator
MTGTTDKLYYTISETAEILQETVTTVRFWEGEFVQISPKKNKRGVRFFTPKDIEHLKQIKFLTRKQGYTLDGAKQRMNHNPQAVDKKMEVIQRLNAIRSYLEDLKSAM